MQVYLFGTTLSGGLIYICCCSEYLWLPDGAFVGRGSQINYSVCPWWWSCDPVIQTHHVSVHRLHVICWQEQNEGSFSLNNVKNRCIRFFRFVTIRLRPWRNGLCGVKLGRTMDEVYAYLEVLKVRGHQRAGRRFSWEEQTVFVQHIHGFPTKCSVVCFVFLGI